jgi:glycosyltransferase involved in cell wall biosynthesis
MPDDPRSPTVSVVIATYNRANRLDDCVAQLSRQQFVPGDELIVVDNGSADATPAVIDRWREVFPVPLRHLHEQRPGKSCALAQALKVASADILAFTDDDVRVDDDWITELRAALSQGDTAMVGGPVEPRWEHQAPRWLRLDAMDYGPMVAPLGLLNYGNKAVPLGTRTLLGANLAVRRDVLQQVGGFALHLGKMRGTLLSGEDHELCRRVQAAGYKALYSPRARVEHWVPAERMRVRYFLSWFFWSGITHASLEQGDRHQHPPKKGLSGYMLRHAAVSLVRAVVAAATGRPSAAVDRAIDMAFAAGYVAGCCGFVTLTAPMRTAGEAI